MSEAPATAPRFGKTGVVLVTLALLAGTVVVIGLGSSLEGSVGGFLTLRFLRADSTLDRGHGARILAIMLVDALFIPALLVRIALHELGHAVAARAIGLTILSYRAGPLMLVREQGRWRLRLHDRPAQVLTGLVSAEGRPLRRPRRDGLLFTLGGIAVDLLLLTMILIAALMVSSVLRPVALGVAAVQGLLIIAELVPRKKNALGIRGSDGYQALEWWRDTEKRKAEWNLNVAWIRIRANLRPRDWDLSTEEVARAVPFEDTGAALLFALMVAYDRDEPAVADRLFEAARPRFGSFKPGALAEVVLQRVLWIALVENDGFRADAQLGEALKAAPKPTPLSMSLACAAILQATGRVAQVKGKDVDARAVFADYRKRVAANTGKIRSDLGYEWALERFDRILAG